MTELLPCPFCGGDKPYVYGPTCNKNTPYNPADRAAPWVVCGQCHAVIHGMDWDESKESAIANWNRRAHLSQPQPVAQGEAVGLQPHKWERKYTGTGRTVWECSECFRYGGFAERPCSEPSKHPGCNADALQATPTIPTGHRVVPVEPTAAMIWDMAKVVHDKGDAGLSADKFYTLIYKAMLAAAPDGEVG